MVLPEHVLTKYKHRYIDYEKYTAGNLEVILTNTPEGQYQPFGVLAVSCEPLFALRI
jgi:hypothetical protein